MREHSALWQHMYVYEGPTTVSKVLYTLAGSPPTLEALGVSLSRLWVNPTLVLSLYLRGFIPVPLYEYIMYLLLTVVSR